MKTGIIFLEVPHTAKRPCAYAFHNRAEFIEWVEWFTWDIETENPTLEDRIDFLRRDLNHVLELDHAETMQFLDKKETRGHMAIEKYTEVECAAKELDWIQ